MKILNAKEIEKLENTSIASALMAGTVADPNGLLVPGCLAFSDCVALSDNGCAVASDCVVLSGNQCTAVSNCVATGAACPAASICIATTIDDQATAEVGANGTFIQLLRKALDDDA